MPQSTYNGTPGNDFVVSGYSYLRGLGGNDNLATDLSGSATVEGDDGNDFIFYNGGSPRTGTLSLYGGAGNDFVVGSDGSGYSDLLYADQKDTGADVGNDLILGGYSSTGYVGYIIPTPYGPSGNDTEYGGNGVDGLYGFDGNDSLYGGGGNDIGTVTVASNFYYQDNTTTATAPAGLYGGDGDDFLYGGAGNDLVYGDNADGSGVGGSDHLYGSFGNDQLAGQGGNDIIFGEADNDSIYGGSGINTLYGGDGADNFYIGSPSDGYDYIGDFAAYQYDALVFTSANFGGITNATITSHFYSGAGFAGFAVAGPYFAYDTNSGNLWYNTPGYPTLVAELTVGQLSSSSMFFS